MVGFVRVRLVHCHASSRSLDSFVRVRSIPVLPERYRVRSGALCPFLSAQVVVGFVRMRSVYSRAPWWSAVSCGCFRSISVSSVSRRIRSSAFAPFQCALGVVVLVRERTVHSCEPRGSFRCFRPIPMRPGCRRVHFRAP